MNTSCLRRKINKHTISYKGSKKHTIKHERGQSPVTAASPVLLMQSFTRFCCCCCSKGTVTIRDRKHGMQVSSLTLSLALSPPASTMYHRTPPQKNSAFMLTYTLALVLRGFVLSRGWSSPEGMVGRSARVRGGRKMLTSLSPRAKRRSYIRLA